MLDPVPQPPDFVVEVLSPADQAGRVLERIGFLLDEGVGLVWVVDPEARHIAVHEPGKPFRIVRAGTLAAAPVLPGFSLDVDALFALVAESS